MSTEQFSVQPNANIVITKEDLDRFNYYNSSELLDIIKHGGVINKDIFRMDKWQYRNLILAIEDNDVEPLSWE